MTTIPGTIYTLSYTREFSLLPHADLLQAFRPVALIGFFGGRSHRRPEGFFFGGRRRKKTEDVHTLAVGCSLWRRRAKSDPDAVPWPSRAMAMFDETGKRSQDRRAYVHPGCRPTATSGCYQEVIRTSPLTSSGGPTARHSSRARRDEPRAPRALPVAGTRLGSRTGIRAASTGCGRGNRAGIQQVKVSEGMLVTSEIR